jgi:pimeloyl-ACP methyl ester carboxylesterase
MADDAAGLARSLGYQKVNVLAYSMGARIGQQLLIRHTDLVAKAVLSAADPGGRHHLPAAADEESRLNAPRTPVEAGTIPNDFRVPPA